MEWIPEFFEKCKKTDKEYVVVSGFSDFGLALQEEHPVSVDLIKYFPMLHKQIGEAGYSSITIPPRCRSELCDIRHKYSRLAFNVRAEIPRVTTRRRKHRPIRNLVDLLDPSLL